MPVSALAGAAGEYYFGEPGRLAGVVAPAIGTAAKTGGDMLLRGMLRGKSPAQMQANINTLREAGVTTPTVGVASQNITPQGLEATFGRVPGGAGTMRESAERISRGMGEKVDDLATGISKAREKFQAGRSIATGIEKFSDDLGERWATLNKPVDDALKGNTISAGKFAAALEKHGKPIQGAEDLSLILKARDPALAKAYEALTKQNSALPYEATRQLRSAIGEKLSNPQLIDDISRRHYKALYGALTEDIRAAAAAKGPAALKAFDDSNAVFSAGVKRIENVLENIGGKATWEQTFKAAASGAKDGPSKIWALRRSLPESGFKDFQAMFIREMGKKKPGQQIDLEDVFSPETFLTNYQALPPSTMNALFGQSTKLRKSLDTVAEASRMLRESGRTFANPSGTAGATGVMAMGASIPTAFAFMLGGHPGVGLSIIGGAAGLSLGAFQGAKMMTNPKFVEWLAQSTTIPVDKLAAHAGRLKLIAAHEQDADQKENMYALANQFIGPRRIYSKAPDQEQP
jgi:hypothetical protein